MIWIATAMAIDLDRLATVSNEARLALEACDLHGCLREDAAESAWTATLGAFLLEGRIDGELAATVRELDPALFSTLNPEIQLGATEPLSWSLRVGGRESAPAPVRRVFVSGEVVDVGAFPCEPELTVVDVITLAGGPTKFAATGRVLVLRGEERIRVDVGRVLRGKDPNVLVEPGDRVVVPTNAL